MQMRLSCQGEQTVVACRSNQPLVRHKEFCIRIRTQSGLHQGLPICLRYIRLYLIFVLYELSSALSLGKHSLVFHPPNANGPGHHKRVHRTASADACSG